MSENVTLRRPQGRKAVTRARIISAANHLFEQRGYDAVSVEDIAVAAEIATRTIYLHFDSKASIFLAYVDEWNSAFVDSLLARPIEEPIGDAIVAILGTGDRSQWTNPVNSETPSQHPVVSFIGEGPLEIAGRIMHSWVAAQDRIAEDAQRRGNFAPGSLEPRARAATVFAVWMASTLVFRAGQRGNGLPLGVKGSEVAVQLAQLMGSGSKV